MSGAGVRSAPKAKPKRKAKKKPEPDEQALTVPEQNLFLLRQIESLKHRLVMQTNKSTEADTTVRDLRSKLQQLQMDYESEQKRAFDIAADMTRQYKGMRDELLKKIGSLEKTITDCKDQLDALRQDKDEMEHKKDLQIAMKDAEIAEQKRKMDQMASEFGQMLKDTLDKMNERVVITTEWEADKAQPVVRTFEDLRLVAKS